MLIYINKPMNFDSFWIIKKLKRIFFDQKVWHSWILDYPACWLMIVWIWKDTKKLFWFQNMKKEYICTIDFSLSTDSFDLKFKYKFEKYPLIFNKGQIIWILKNSKLIKKPTFDKLKKICLNLIWKKKFNIPMFSSKRYKWKKLYEYAFKWEKILLKKEMEIFKIDVLEYNFPRLRLKLDVSSWTYIRTISNFIWEKMWMWWTLIFLQRTTINNISIFNFNKNEKN